MPKITFLPHESVCPDGIEFQTESGISVLDAALAHDIDIEHVCEKSCACTTCHVIVRQGFYSLEDATDQEEDLLDRAWGLEPESRLACQAIVTEEDLVIEIPKYTLNQVSEHQ